MPDNLVPITSESMGEVQIDAGACFVGIDPRTHSTKSALAAALALAIGDPNKCVGITRGGGNFTDNMEMREIEFDGKRNRVKGGTRVLTHDPVLTTTILTVTPENLKRVFVTSDIARPDTGSERTGILTRNDIKDDDYMNVFLWVGKTKNGYRAIALYNAINLANGQIAFSDRNEATMPIEIHGTAENYLDDKPPFDVFSFEPAAAVSSAAAASIKSNQEG